MNDKIERTGPAISDFRLLPGYYQREVELCKQAREFDAKIQGVGKRPLEQNQTLFSLQTWDKSNP